MTIDTTSSKKPKLHASHFYNPKVELEEFADVPYQLVYEWVKTGKWKIKHFSKWLLSIRVLEQ